MIKTGIVGGAEAMAAELLRLLLHHPDVDLRWVLSESHAGQLVAQLHQSLTGETQLAFSEQPEWEALDVVFVCDARAADAAWLEQVPQQVRVIDLSPSYRLTDEQDSGFTYGMSEINRRRMVHDCMRVSCPSDVAMALSLALIPLAKNLMVNSELHAMVVVGNAEATTGSRVEMVDDGTYSGSIDEVRRVLATLQASFASPIHLTAMRACFARGLLATVYFKSGIDVDMVKQLFEQYYDDHNFTFVIDRSPRLGDVAGTNKCLIHIAREGDFLRLTSAIDDRIKGTVGTAVHAMNLLFGLHERVGLML
ncbi:MAG: N-acetyl-gamma-glutamyl-phosphate reductase [Muribaculaceae bacterium]|nr:N-acetyl-gamma-glutamyl-phosphate reductase [Muribaculaceae bacterium]